MKKTKKIISLLLSILMIITSIPLMAVNSFAATSGDYEYRVLDDGTAEITKFTGSVTELEIPSEIDGYRVTGIGWSAFAYCRTLISVIIPDSVMSIRSNAFLHCSAIESITMPNNVTNIASLAFNGCISLKNITIPDSVTKIMSDTFLGCTSLTNVTIGKGVTSIDSSAFRDCTSITEINVSSENADYSSENGVVFNKDKTALVKYPEGKTKLEYTIPDSVTIIGDDAFNGCTSLASITMPNSVTNIGWGAFRNCTSLTRITIPDSVTSIYDSAFSGCTSLTSITIPESVTEINTFVFYGCTSLANITIPDSITNICFSAFDDTAYYNNEDNWNNGILYICNHLIKAKSDVLGSLEITQGTKTIAEGAFADCISLTSITIPDSVTNIGMSAFYGCKALTSIGIGNRVTRIGESAFELCTSLTNITIPDSVTSIGYSAFRGCKNLNSITFGKGLIYIDASAFNDCELLSSVTIPANVEEIGEDAFGYCDNKEIFGFIIYGFTGSEAERYANDNRIRFVSLGSAPIITFPDVTNNAWYYPSVVFNVTRGYLKGYGNGTFGPADNIQRQDFVVLLSRIAGADLSKYEGQNSGFVDVPTGTYFSAAVAWAKDNNILSGYANGLFGVGDPITREQACKIFYNYCNGSVSGNTSAILANYPDGAAVSDWAKDYVAWAAENHVVGGNGTLNPAGNANRAEMAQIIMNMSNNDIL